MRRVMEEFANEIREDSLAEGRAEGRQEIQFSVVELMTETDTYSAEEIARIAQLPVDDVIRIQESLRA